MGWQVDYTFVGQREFSPLRWKVRMADPLRSVHTWCRRFFSEIGHMIKEVWGADKVNR